MEMRVGLSWQNPVNGELGVKKGSKDMVGLVLHGKR